MVGETPPKKETGGGDWDVGGISASTSSVGKNTSASKWPRT